MDLAALKKVYFIGIGGIGMSAIAQYFLSKGIEIFGYDKTPSPQTDKLMNNGVAITFKDATESLPQDVDLVIYTPAIPKDNKIFTYYSSGKYELKKRSEILQMITQTAFTIAVAGSHGKTTVSSMIAHMLKVGGIDCTAFLGGIAVNYQSNFIKGNDEIMVVEADEYDRSFLRLSPNIAIITAVDSDHLDIYGNTEEVQQAFIQFSEKALPEGCVIVEKSISILNKITHQNLLTYSARTADADTHLDKISIKNNAYHFTVSSTANLPELTLNIGGKYNIDNVLAAIAVAIKLHIDPIKIQEAISSFKGVKRRFEYIIKTNKYIYIDDYAHHPEEIKVVLHSIKELYPSKRLTVIFQPHLYSRTRDHADGFASSLSIADEVILLEIYPAREMPIEGVDAAMVANKINKKVSIVSKKEVLEAVRKKGNELVVTMGAGDIDELVPMIKNIMLEKIEQELDAKLNNKVA